jgi:hypothetical protein
MAGEVGNFYIMCCAQSIMGLAYMHSKGVGHGGKLLSSQYCSKATGHSSDSKKFIVATFSSRSRTLTLSTKEIYERYGGPLKIPFTCMDKAAIGLDDPSMNMVRSITCAILLSLG